jgi:5-methyltetrahydropteroyltriglutamate--homocysteine methyltransferase
MEMKRSKNRILTTHAGSLARPDDLREMLIAKNDERSCDDERLKQRLRSAVAEAVRNQVDSGIDIVNDGELSKTSFSDYVRHRLGGLDPQPSEPYVAATAGRDLMEFPEYFAARREPTSGQKFSGARRMLVSCVEPIKYIGQAAVQADIENFKAALQGVTVEEAFLPAVALGTIEHWLKDAYYPNKEAFLYGIADAMHEEYKAVVDAGFILQIDDPDLADGWQINSHMSVPEYRKFAELRIDALNHALRDIPPQKVRFHVCWGSYHGPHKYDIPLRDIADLILKVRADAYSIEASNPRHEHEWCVWEEVKLPEEKILVPGVVGHATDTVEHPELVAQRLVRYAKLVGRENVIAGTDCGLGPRVGHPKIAWAKFEAMAEGARLATMRLWGR